MAIPGRLLEASVCAEIVLDDVVDERDDPFGEQEADSDEKAEEECGRAWCRKWRPQF